MADGTHIEWTDATWQITTGCAVVSPGCTNCYAMRLAGTRLQHHPSRQGLTRDTKAGPVWTGEVRFNEQWLDQPLRWKRPRRIFVSAHGDLFAENVPDEWIDRVFAVMALAPQHTYQVLTKRAERMREYLRDTTIHSFGPPDLCSRIAAVAEILNDQIFPYAARQFATDVITPGFIRRRWPLPNIWLGVSVEDQARADERIPHLLATPAAVRFISAEPLLGSVDLRRIGPRLPADIPTRKGLEAIEPLTGKRYRYNVVGAGGKHRRPSYTHGWNYFGTGARVDWVIAGGESGPSARPMHPDWARSLRDQCAAAGVPYFFKQHGEWLSIHQCGHFAQKIDADEVRYGESGIELPMMYRHGFSNANCIGCVNAQSPTYWKRVRRCFPEVFANRKALSRELGVRLVKGTTGPRRRYFLDELDAAPDNGQEEPTVECSLLCYIAEQTIAEPAAPLSPTASREDEGSSTDEHR